MKTLKLTSILFAILTIAFISSCEKDDSVTPNPVEYGNSYLIIGNWNVDSSTVNLMFSQEWINLIEYLSTFMSPEEFEEDMGFPMPSSPYELDALAANGIVQDGELTGTVSITSSTFTITDIDDVTELEYQLVDNTIIQVIDPEEEFQNFTINEVSETNLVLTSSFIEEEEEMNMEAIFTIYLSK